MSAVKYGDRLGQYEEYTMVERGGGGSGGEGREGEGRRGQ